MNAQPISERLFKNGIGFVKDGVLTPFSIDDQNPMLPASNYFLNKPTLARATKAWAQWRKFAQKVLSSQRGRDFFESFLFHGTPINWGDFERSEFEFFDHTREYFPPEQLTRIDFAITKEHNLVILDPNVMPYGLAQLVPVQNHLGLESHVEYLERLQLLNPTWVCDRTHGNAHSVRMLTKTMGINFSFSDEMPEGANVIMRQTRRNITGKERTINAPGIRVFETQLWNALMTIPGVGESFGFNVDQPLHTACVRCFLVKIIDDGRLYIAYEYDKGGMHWMNFRSFLSMQWLDVSNLFLKAIFTSGCHQVTWSEPKETKILKAVRSKLGENVEYFLLQPAMNCIVDGERVRVASYVTPDGLQVGSEVTRVPLECKLAHSGGHAKESYLYF